VVDGKAGLTGGAPSLSRGRKLVLIVWLVVAIVVALLALVVYSVNLL